MKFFISSTVLSLLTIQVFLSCNCQIILFPFNEVINFNPSNATYKILKSSDFTNFKTFQSIFLLGKNSYSSITANLTLVYASSLTKAVIRDSAQNDLKKIMKALNAVATSLAGCIPETSYQNDLNVTTACFLADCSNTPVKCQALYIQIVISELMLAINAAASNLNLTSSILVGNGWNFQSLSSVTTQWSIVQASAAGYQNSTTISPMIKRVNSNFKRVLSGALSGTTLFLNSFESGYKTLINSLSNTNYNQTIDDYAALVSLNAAFNADKSFSTDSFNFDGIILKSSSTQFSISGITATSFVRPAAIRVFDSLNDLSSSFNAELSRFQNNMQTIVQIQANAYPTSFKASSFSTKEDIKAVSDVLNSVILSSSMQNQNSKTEISKLITNYTNLINSFTNMTIDCFKVACADNIIYPYSLWNLQCVNDNSFTSFCWNEEIPRTVQRCPSTKAETLNACLDDVASMITSVQPSSDFETILEDTSSSTVELKSSYQSFLTSKNLNYYDNKPLVISFNSG